MAFDYITNPTGFFKRVGKIVKAINSYTALASTTFPADLKAIADLYEAADIMPPVADLYRTYRRFQDDVTVRQQNVARFADNTLLDFPSTLTQLGLLNRTAERTVLLALFRQMILDSQTVKRSTVTLGTVTAAAANVGTGNVFVSTKLDGSTAPGRDFFANPLHHGLASELAVTSETMTARCTATGAVDGEQFLLSGASKFSDFNWQGEGSGAGPTLTVLNARSLISNGEFETWSVTNVPDGWTLGAGTTAGTHVFKEITNFWRGLAAVKLIGNSVPATVKITQALPVAQMKPLTSYCFSVAVKASGVGTGGDDVIIIPTGTGYTAGSDEKVTLSGGALPTTWTQYGRVFRTPATVPTDMTIEIQLTGTPTNTTTVYVDALPVGQPTYHGGICAFAAAGPIAFQKSDRFAFTVVNDDAGVWQKFARQWWKLQFPSVGGSAETVLDNLAT